jgi:RNA polymerase sigma factor (sigma-70 family)
MSDQPESILPDEDPIEPHAVPDPQQEDIEVEGEETENDDVDKEETEDEVEKDEVEKEDSESLEAGAAVPLPDPKTKAAVAEKSEEGGRVKMDWSRLDETAAQCQNLTWSYIVTGLEDFTLQAWMVHWLQMIRDNAAQWRKNIESIDDIVRLFSDESEVEIEEFALEKMLRVLPLRWEEHLELLRVFQQSEMGHTQRMTTIRSLMETAFESILANLIPFVRAHTRRYERQITSSSIQREDLVGTGILGVAKALRAWDREKGPFLNYAKIWMTNEILDQLRSQSVVHAKEKMAELQGGLDGAFADLMVRLQREPDIEELAEYLGKPVETIKNAIKWRTSVISLDQPSAGGSSGGEDSTSLYDVIPDKMESTLIGDMDREKLMETLKKEVEPILIKTGGILGFRLETHLLQDANGPPQPLSQAIEVLREIGYNNLRRKLSQIKKQKDT